MVWFKINLHFNTMVDICYLYSNNFWTITDMKKFSKILNSTGKIILYTKFQLPSS